MEVLLIAEGGPLADLGALSEADLAVTFNPTTGETKVIKWRYGYAHEVNVRVAAARRDEEEGMGTVGEPGLPLWAVPILLLLAIGTMLALAAIWN